MADELDDFDLKILRLLQIDARLKSEAIAEEVGLSATAVQRRIKKLRDRKVIASEIAVVDPEAVGGRLTLVVGVVVEHGRPDIMDGFRRKARQAPEVQQCYWVTGAFDFILIVSVATMAEYEALTRRLFIDDPGIRHFDTSVTMDTVKRGLAITL
ncbi:MAG: Lrp/AsnC family transcriptional regulator [Pseudomonadota bacterium]